MRDDLREEPVRGRGVQRASRSPTRRACTVSESHRAPMSRTRGRSRRARSTASRRTSRAGRSIYRTVYNFGLDTGDNLKATNVSTVPSRASSRGTCRTETPRPVTPPFPRIHFRQAPCPTLPGASRRQKAGSYQPQADLLSADVSDDEEEASPQFSPEVLTAIHIARFGAGGSHGTMGRVNQRRSQRRTYAVPEDGAAWDLAIASACRDTAASSLPPSRRETSSSMASRLEDSDSMVRTASATHFDTVRARRRLESVVAHLSWQGG